MLISILVFVGIVCASIRKKLKGILNLVTNSLLAIIGKQVWMGMWFFELAIVNKFEFIYDSDWAFTSMDTKIDCPTFYAWGLKSTSIIAVFQTAPVFLLYTEHCQPSLKQNENTGTAQIMLSPDTHVLLIYFWRNVACSQRTAGCGPKKLTWKFGDLAVIVTSKVPVFQMKS